LEIKLFFAGLKINAMQDWEMYTRIKTAVKVLNYPKSLIKKSA
jgi:hypothetical protein